MTEIIFARHGETQNNKDGILQGHLDVSLNEKGIQDAKELAENFKEIRIDSIYSSDLKRAIQCSKEIQKYFPDLTINLEPRLRERHFGDHQGKSILDLGYPDITYPNLVRHLYNCSCPNGENNQELLKRLNSFLEDILENEQRNLSVTHGGIVMLAINSILNEEIKYENSRQHKNGYVSYFKFKGKKVVDSLINVHVSELVGYLK